MSAYTDSFSNSFIPDNVHITNSDTYCQGSVINEQYYVECVLPGGSMGRVFKCRDLMTGDEIVVKGVKESSFLHPEKQDEAVREIRNWMKLPRCSNLVNIAGVFYDSADQTLFLTMPYIRGHQKYGLELKEWMKTYRFTELDIVYTGIAVCQAMKECMEQTGSVPVHGDIKPSNIFLEYRGEKFENQPFLNCNIRLADCGVSGHTKKYFPEEYEEYGLSPDNASDVYALITVLCEMAGHVSEDYDEEHSIIHFLSNLLIGQKQWKIYNLAEILEDFLLPACEARFGISPDILLYKDIRPRPLDIFYRVQDIRNELQMVRKNDQLLEEVDALWREAKEQGYVLNGIPLTCYIDRHFYTCAELGEKHDLAEKILCRYEEALFALPEEERKVFGYMYSSDLRDEFAILHARLKAVTGQNSAAQALFHGIDLEPCICYKWLEQYVDICLEDILKGQEEEGRYIQRKLRSYINICGQKKGMKILTELEKFLGVITMNLGETEESVAILEKCVDRYPDELDFLYYYGYALLLNGQVSKARYPLHILYYHCKAVRERSKDENGRLLYPGQTIALYSHMSSYMCGDFMVALRDIDEFERQQLYYQGKVNDGEIALARKMTQDALDVHYQLRKRIVGMSAEDVLQNFAMYCIKWKQYLSSPFGHMGYLYRRGELQVLADLHTCFADWALANGRYDELVQSCQYMLSVWKDSGTVRLYLARAYVMKGNAELAARFYKESADMLKYDYPQVRRDGTESEPARKERERMQKEMAQCGLDGSVIRIAE